MGCPVLSARSTVVQALEDAGIKAFEEWPNTLTPPAAVVVPGQPYIERGTRFGEYQENIRVFIIMAHSASNKKTLDDLDNILDQIIEQFENNSIPFGEVDAPEGVEIDGKNYYAVSLTTSNERHQRMN